MKAIIFHKTFELNIPQDVAPKYMKACELLDKAEEAIKESKPDIDITSDELFPLIALSAVVKQTSSNIDNLQNGNDIHKITIKLPSFNNISTMLNVRIKANPSYERFTRIAAAKISSNCEIFKARFNEEDTDLYRMAVVNVLIEQL